MTVIHVTDPDTDALVRRLASHLKVGLTEAINKAVVDKLSDEGVSTELTQPALGKGKGRNALLDRLEDEIRIATREYTGLVAKARKKARVGSRVYQMLSRYGVLGALERLIDRGSTEGLEFLAQHERLDLAAETIALKDEYKTIITEAVKAQARANLAKVRG